MDEADGGARNPKSYKRRIDGFADGIGSARRS